jgi:hypothetical protein
MGNFFGRHVEMPVTNENTDSTQVSGIQIGNTFNKEADEDNRSNSNSSSDVNVYTAGDSDNIQRHHETEKTIMKLAMGAVIVIQAALLFCVLLCWAVAYRRAKKAIKKTAAIQRELSELHRIPPAGSYHPAPDAHRRSRSRRDEERIHQTNVTTFHAGAGVVGAPFVPPPSYNTTNIVC